MPSAFAIRPARPDDVPALLGLIGGLARFHNDTPAIDAPILLRDAFTAPRWIEILVAEAEARLVGYTVLCPLYRAQFGQRGLDMHHLFVVEDWRSKGVGRGLIDAMLARAGELHCAYVKVGTHPDNAAAQGFYESCGFQRRLAGTQFYLRLAPTIETRTQA